MWQSFRRKQLASLTITITGGRDREWQGTYRPRFTSRLSGSCSHTRAHCVAGRCELVANEAAAFTRPCVRRMSELCFWQPSSKTNAAVETGTVETSTSTINPIQCGFTNAIFCNKTWSARRSASSHDARVDTLMFRYCP